MPDLPFLVVHGALCWKLVLVALTVGTTYVLSQRTLPAIAVVVGGVSALPWYICLYLVGQQFLPVHGVRADELTPLGTASLAAALPSSREDALRAIVYGTDKALAHDEAGLATGLALDRFRGVCPVDRLERAGDYLAAGEAARQCGSREVRAGYLLMLGDFDQATRLMKATDRPEDRALALIATGRWREASVAVAAIDRHPADTVLKWCFGQWLAGHDQPDRGLSVLAIDPSESCQVFAALARGQVPAPSRFTPRGFAASIAAELSVPDLEQLRYGTWDTSDYLAIWVSPSIAQPPEPQRAQYVSDLRASRDLYVGELAAARRELASDPVELDGYLFRGAVSSRREARIELAAIRGGPVPPREVDSRERTAADILRGDHMAIHGDGAPDSGCDRLAIDQAMEGDGRPLATDLTHCTLRDGVNFAFLALSSRITMPGRLAAASRFSRFGHDVFQPPFGRIATFARYRDVARNLGDNAEADGWQPVIDRYAAVFSDRDRSIAISVLSSL